jgi:hypothetical protein
VTSKLNIVQPEKIKAEWHDFFITYKTTDTAVISFVFPSWIINEFFKYYLKNEQECFIRFKARARSASGFRPNKTRPASFLNGFKSQIWIWKIFI